MEFFTPSVIFALLVLIVLLLFWVFNFLIFYHLIRFGIGTQPKKISAIYLFGSVGLFFISVMLLSGIDVDATKAEALRLLEGLFSLTILT